MPNVKIITNRMRAHLDAAWQIIEKEGWISDRRVLFTYMCGEDAELVLKPNDRFFRLIAPKVYNPYADKGRLPGIVSKFGLNEHFPITCSSVDEALGYSEVALWFSKNRYGTAGKGMTCVARDDLRNYEVPEHHILQAGVEDIALHEDRKFTTRIYLLVWNGRVWFYEDGFNIIHGVPYVARSTDYAVQILHDGYHQPDSPVRLTLFSEYALVDRYWSALREAAATLCSCFADLKAGSSSSEYLFLGIDCLLLRDGGLKFLEVNAIPNFIHTKQINEQLNVPFIASCLRVMMGGDDPKLSRIG